MHQFRPVPILLLSLSALLLALTPSSEAAERPNILWITSEDNGPQLGCYGDEYATSPHIDALAGKGLRYLNCWSTAPVCAPARTTIISGLYPTSLGAQHMRSQTGLPAAFKMYPQYLREAGYFCTNNSKEDYNLAKPGVVWDASNGRAHWKNRKPGQPFFAIFNYTTSHESQIRKRPHKAIHDPAKVRVPAYHPDTPEVRQDWAQYYDKITEMDRQVGKALRELEEAGLADDTIVFYYGDHGSGMPRSKRWPYNSGLHVPLIVHVPEQFKELAPPDYSAGGKTDRLVGFIDLAPTLLSLIGVEPPQHFQGHAFMGKFRTPGQPFIHGFRGRMDERYDMVRSVRDKRYIYIRNYMPHKAYGQHVGYMFQTPTTQVWSRLNREGQLNEAQSRFWNPKPPEELYDLRDDRDEVHNLAKSAGHQEILDRLRKAQQAHAMKIRDLGFLPEGEIHSRSKGETPYEMGHDPAKYPLREIIVAAELASALQADSLPLLKQRLGHADSAVRYWSFAGILMRGQAAIDASKAELLEALGDSSPYVRTVAAEALGHDGSAEESAKAVQVLLAVSQSKSEGPFPAIMALNVIDQLDGKAASVQDDVAKIKADYPGFPKRSQGYVERLVKKTLGDLK